MPWRALVYPGPDLGGKAAMTANTSVTNATTTIVGPTFAIPPSTLTVGQVWRARAYYTHRRGTTTTAQNLVFTLDLGTATDLVLTIPAGVLSNGQYAGWVEAQFTVRSVGASGTVMSALHATYGLGINSDAAASQDVSGTNAQDATAGTINTAASTTFRILGRMSAAVANTTLTFSQGLIERVL